MIVYISYDEPGRSAWRVALGILAILIALGIIVAVVGAVLWWVNNNQGGAVSAPAPASVAPPADAVSLQQAVTSLHEPDTNTIFLVDASQSIELGGDLDVVRQSLVDVVLPYVDPSAGVAAQNSRAALITFTQSTNAVVPLGVLTDPDNQRAWLANAGTLATVDEGAFIYDAVKEAHNMLAMVNDDTRSNVIVLLTDGADGGIEVPSGNTVHSETSRDALVAMLATSPVHDLTVHTIGFGAEADHVSLKILAQATSGKYTYASR